MTIRIFLKSASSLYIILKTRSYGELSERARTQSALKNLASHLSFLSQIKSKNFKEAKLDEFKISAMQEDLSTIIINKARLVV